MIGTLFIIYALPKKNTFLIVPLVYGIIIIIILLLSLKKKYIIIYENGINFPPSFFTLLRKSKSLYGEDIKSITTDKEKKSLIIKMKSGKEYNYDNCPSYAKTDQLYPIVKNAFEKYKHIEFIG